MRVAVFGCLHGMLNEMYAAVAKAEESASKIDLILVCGDCQTLRHPDDLRCIAVPDKFKDLGDFHEYYSGKKKVPKLTIFIGGNHEASNYLMTLPYGGWVCDNFYYLGYSGVVKYKGLRIAGVSGIHNHRNRDKGRFERMPLDGESIRSIYHTRRLDIFRLQLLSANINNDPIDAFLSHDWPKGIYDYGNKEQLLQFKPHLRKDVESRWGLGNPQMEPLVKQLKPRRWFAAHLHCRFYAKVQHENPNGRCTEFLSLNKIENRRNFMEVLDLTTTRDFDESDDDLYYDEEWLTILRKTVNLEINSRNNVFCPNIQDPTGQEYLPTVIEIQETTKMMNETGGLKIKKNFRMTEPVIYNRPHGIQPSMDRERIRSYPNYQHEELVSRIKLDQKDIKQEQGASARVEQDVKPDIKPKVEGDLDVKPKIELDKKPELEVDVKPNLKEGPPSKRRACQIELEEDCLPVYIDTEGDK